MVGRNTAINQVTSKYFEKKIRFTTPTHTGYNLNHTVVTQRNEFV